MRVMLSKIFILPEYTTLFGKNKLPIVTNFSSVLFNTQVRALNNGGHLYKFINVFFASIMKHN